MGLASVPIRSTKPPSESRYHNSNHIIQTVILASESNIFTVINVDGGGGGGVCVCDQDTHEAGIPPGGSEPASPGMFSVCLLQAFGFATLQSTSVNRT